MQTGSCSVFTHACAPALSDMTKYFQTIFHYWLFLLERQKTWTSSVDSAVQSSVTELTWCLPALHACIKQRHQSLAFMGIINHPCIEILNEIACFHFF